MRLESEIYEEVVASIGDCFAVERLENAVKTGTLDVTVSCDNRTIWVELKRSVDEELRGSQVAWLLKRHKSGCNCDAFILTMEGDEFLIAWAYDVALSGKKLKDCTHVKSGKKELVMFFLFVFTNLLGVELHDGEPGTEPGVSPVH